MKRGHCPDALRVADECLAAVDLRLFHLIEGVKVAIGDAFVGQGPEPLAWLQFG